MGTRRSPMQVAIEEILEAHNLLEEFNRHENSFHVKFEMGGYQPLVIERHGDTVSVTHYFIQMGDVMYDPDMTFSLKAGWMPMEYTLSSLGVYHRVAEYRDGKLYTSRKGVADLKSFARTWAKNLREQMWAEDATIASNLSEED